MNEGKIFAWNMMENGLYRKFGFGWVWIWVQSEDGWATVGPRNCEKPGAAIDNVYSIFMQVDKNHVGSTQWERVVHRYGLLVCGNLR